MNKREYFAQVAEWRRKYPTPTKPLHAPNLAKTRVNGCIRCGRKDRKLNRHHVACDFYFALMLPDVFAPRYIRFLDEDIVHLCQPCHKLAHTVVYDPLKAELWRELDNIKREKLEDFARRWMKRYREAFFVWLKQYHPRPRSRLVTK